MVLLYIAQTGQELADPPTSASQLLVLQGVLYYTSYKVFFKKIPFLEWGYRSVVDDLDWIPSTTKKQLAPIDPTFR